MVEVVVRDALARKLYHKNPPSWYFRQKGASAANNLRWITFRDADGKEATALLDTKEAVVVTLAKEY